MSDPFSKGYTSIATEIPSVTHVVMGSMQSAHRTSRSAAAHSAAATLRSTRTHK